MSEIKIKVKKLVVIFPGIGYTVDKPLLYHGRKLLKEAGYEECIQVAYTYPGETRIRGNLEKMEEAFRILYVRTQECLKNVDWSAYDEILFLSKSIGTVIAAAFAEKNGLNGKKIRHVLYTPLTYTFQYHPQNAIGFIGTADSWCVPSEVLRLSEEQGISMYVYEQADHSLETGNVLHDLDTLKDVMEKTKKYVYKELPLG